MGTFETWVSQIYEIFRDEFKIHDDLVLLGFSTVDRLQDDHLYLLVSFNFVQYLLFVDASVWNLFLSVLDSHESQSF